MELSKFSISPANTYKACPRKFFYEYVEGFEPSVRPRWLNIGSTYDEALAVMDVQGKEDCFAYAQSKLTPYEFVDFCFIMQRYYLPYIEQNPMPPVKDGNQFGFGEVPYERADWKITGYIDKVSSKNGEYWVIERKTTTKPIEEKSEYWNVLDLDPQIRSYVWAMKQKGVRAGWVRYEVIRKINSTLVSGLNRQLPLEEYAQSLETWFQKHGSKKTVVAFRDVYISDNMTKDFVAEHAVVRNQILQSFKLGQDHPDLFDAVWVKHEKSCESYGGCPFLDVCKGVISLPNEKFTQTHKVLK